MRGTASLVLLSFVSVACTRTSTPSTTQRVATSAPDAATPVVLAGSPLARSASKGPNAPADASPPLAREAELPLPAAVAGTDAEKVRIAASVCAASYMRSPVTKQRLVGCVFHPPFDGEQQRPDGRLTEYTGDPLAFCSIDEVYRGSFTSPGAKEAVVVFSQCKTRDDDTWDMGFPGSAMLVEATGDRWRGKAYLDGVNMGGCRRTKKREGREVLVCESSFWAGPAGQLAYVFVVDFAQAKAATTLARLYSDVFGCGWSGDTLPDGFARTSLKNIAFVDDDKDGVTDVVLTVTRSRAAPSAAADARVKAACAKNQESALPIAMPPETRHKLLFVGTSTGYVADAATARTLAAWAVEDPAGYHGIGGVAP